jgi:hypothetical protein
MSAIKPGKGYTHDASEWGVVNGERVMVPDLRAVEVLAVAGIWAMVRRPGCMPYIAHVNRIKKGGGK